MQAIKRNKFLLTSVSKGAGVFFAELDELSKAFFCLIKIYKPYKIVP